MEELGEKYAFLAGKKCGSRKVLRFIRSLLHALTVQSLPPRGAWIEIFQSPASAAVVEVAPPAGSVD